MLSVLSFRIKLKLRFCIDKVMEIQHFLSTHTLCVLVCQKWRRPSDFSINVKTIQSMSQKYFLNTTSDERINWARYLTIPQPQGPIDSSVHYSDILVLILIFVCVYPQPPVREGPVTRSASRAASLHSLSDASSDSFNHSPGESSSWGMQRVLSPLPKSPLSQVVL